ncbi:hypothetical protein FS837_012199 [Tulasnella sp. UAMH 9824]|nr:hypothetical protein FS837_012199 [Tulasnella sp. UAMH 9824]
MPSKHPKYGDATYLVFLVEDILFQLPLRRLKQSQYFRDMIEETHTGLEGEGNSDEKPILLRGITLFEMISFLDATEASFLDGDPQLTFNQWAAGLHLATMWGFDDIRKKIIGRMDVAILKVDPLDRVDASLKCRVQKWLHPAYEVLCKRDKGLSNDEAQRLGLQRSAAIWRIRESVLSHKAQSLPNRSTGSDQPDLFTIIKSWQFGGARDERENRDANSHATSLDVMKLIKQEEALKYS